LWVTGHLLIASALLALFLMFLRHSEAAENRLRPYLPLIVLGALWGSIIPDLDVVVGAFWGFLTNVPSDIIAKEFHHTFTHSLIILGALLIISIAAIAILKDRWPVKWAYFAGASSLAAMIHGVVDLGWLDPVAIVWPFGGRYHFGLTFTDEYARVVIMNADLLLAAVVLLIFIGAFHGHLSKWVNIGLGLSGILNITFFGCFIYTIPEYLKNNQMVQYSNFGALVLMIFEMLWLSFVYSFRIFPGPPIKAAVEARNKLSSC
jgi:hypothetical protein